MGSQLGPGLGPAWAQLGPSLGPGLGPGLGPDAAPAAPAPDEFSDPNLTPLPTHPGIKYVARTRAATCNLIRMPSTFAISDLLRICHVTEYYLQNLLYLRVTY